MKRLLLACLVIGLFALSQSASAAALVVSPERPMQGEPIMIRVEGLSATTSVQSISIDGKKLGVFPYMSGSTALYGFDINKKAGSYEIRAALFDGSTLVKEIPVKARKRYEAPLGIPQKLGGNTATSSAALVSTLATENASLLGLRTGDHAFWTKPFQHPVKDPVVTDEYGYSRKTVGQTITHKGTDFRAKEGTPVLAMNRGVVRLAQEGRNYGKTVVIDHGLGVQTLYMHLSRIDVNVGELVLPGQTIGLSGSTGYAESAHLHLSVRIGEVSVDPVVFLRLFR